MTKTKRLNVFLSVILVLNVFLGNLGFHIPSAEASNDLIINEIINDHYENMSSRSDLEEAGYVITPAANADSDVTVIPAAEIINAKLNNPNTGNVLFLKDTTSANTTQFTRSLPEAISGLVTVEFDWRSNENGPNTQSYRLMRLENDKGEGFVEIRISDSGRNISHNIAGSNKRLVTDFQADTWYYFKIVLNTYTQQAEVFVRAEGQENYTTAGPWGFHQAVSSSEVTQLSSFSQKSPTASYYIDNLRVYTITERPAAPTNLAATVGDGEVNLSWNAVSGATGYKVQQSTTSGGPYTEVATSVTNAYTASGLTNGTTYYFTVSALNGGLESGASTEISATPLIPQRPVAPTNVEVTPGNGQVKITWSPVGNADSYTVSRSETAGGAYATVAENLTVTNYTDTGLVNDTTYYYVVSATNELGESGYSSEVTATPLDSLVNTPKFDLEGYATLNGGTTGGVGGDVVYVDNGAELYDILKARIKIDVPLTVYITGKITPENSGGNKKIDVKDVSNVSIIGVGTQGEFEGIGITLTRANNIIIQNLKMHHVNTGEKTAIEVTSSSHNVWIDHNEFYSNRNQGVDYYDGLVDIKRNSEYVTVSWNKFHDHFKTSLNGHTDDGSLAPNNITYHHNFFYNVNSRVPLIRYADVHMYNNYMKDVEDTAINARNGARVLVENNYFENVGNGEIDPVTGHIKGAVGWFYGSPTTGYWNLKGNTFVNTPHEHLTSTTDFTVPYQYSLHSAEEAKVLVERYAGVGIIDGDGQGTDPGEPVPGEPDPGDETEPSNTIFVDEDFDQVETGSQPEGFVFGGDQGSVVELAGRAGKVLLLPASSLSNSFTKGFTPQTETVVAQLDFMQPTRSNSAHVLVLLDSNGTEAVRIETRDHYFKSRLADNSFVDSPVENTNNTWTKVAVVADITTQSFDLYLNGELALEQQPFYRQVTNIAQVKSATPGSSIREHYVDNLKVSQQLIEEDAPVEEEPPVTPVDPEDPIEIVDGVGGIYEAEYAEFHAAIIDNKHVGFTGIGFVDYFPNAPGGWIEWTVDVPVAGEYVLDFRYAHGGSDLRPKEIEVNGEVVNPSLAFDPSGGWATWVYTSTKAQLQAGENKIRAIGNAPSGGANVDHLKVYLEFDEIYEAEDAEFEAAIIDNKHVGFTGTGFVDYVPNAPGGWIEWTVDIPVAGTYNLDFRYAHGGSDLRPKEILLNGEVIEAELAFDPSGGWATWVYTSTQATLEAGKNVIRAVGNAPSGGANVDHLRIHNKPEGSEGEKVELEVGEITDILSGLQLKALEEMGLVGAKKNDDELISRIEFMSIVNGAFGFVKNEKYKNLSPETKVWEVSLDEWYSYVLEAAKEAGYMTGLEVNGNIKPDQHVTKQDVETIFANLQVTADVSAVSDVLTWGEAKALVTSLAVTNKDHVNIVGVHAVANNVLAVTFDSYFAEFDFDDLEVVGATRDWALLSPGFKNLRIDKGAKGINKFGQTVVVLRSIDQWDEFAEFQHKVEPVKFSGNLAQAIQKADNLVSWQMDHGGWTKAMEAQYSRLWNGTEPRSTQFAPDGTEIGTIDNDATITEILFLAQIYQETGDERYKESVLKGFDFLLTMQYSTGGFPQVYPKRGTPGSSVYYSNYVTYNDEAMINVLELMDSVIEKRYPFDTDIIDELYYLDIKASKDKGVDYLLKSQIEVDGKLTAWGQQHHPETYEPMIGRSYELPSISAGESVGVIRYLMSRPQTPEVKRAVLAALEWLDEVKLEGTRYVSGDPNNVYFVADPNSTAWYRFYEIGTNKGIFSGRDGVKKYNIMEIEEERRNGYAWGGHWGSQILNIAQTTGYFTDKVYVQVANTNSVDTTGRSLVSGEIMQAKGQTKQLGEFENILVVAKDGSGDYTTVQAAIDAVPANNTAPVTIFVKNGVYKEVVTVPASKRYITLIGESAEETIITYDNYAGRDNGLGGTLGTSGSASVYLRASDFRAENLTFENSFDESLDVSGKQAVAVYASGDRMFFKNVRFIGNQDTLYTHSGSQYFYQVYVEGDVDFIFGGARAVFEDSQIHSLDRGSSTNNGYITAASTLITDPYGILILNSRVTSDAPAGTVYLGRPWQSGGNPNAIASVVFMNSELGAHINPVGWTSMSGFQPEDARLFEYKNYGPGAVVNESRRQLTDEEAAEWTVKNVLKGWDPNPQAPGEEEPGDGDGGEEPGDGGGEPEDVVYEETVIVDENFDDVATGSQPEGFVFVGDTGEVVELEGRSGKVLLLPASSTSNGFIKEFAPQTGLVVAELEFMQPTRSNATTVLALADSNGNDVIRIEIRDNHFKSRLSDNTFEDSGVFYNSGDWVNVKVVANLDTQTFDLYLDGELVLGEQPFYRGALDIAQVKSATPGSSIREHYVDNLKVSKLVEVQAPVEEEPSDGTPGGEEPGDGEETPGGEEPGDGEETPGSEEPGEETPGTEEPGDGDGEETPGEEAPGSKTPGEKAKEKDKDKEKDNGSKLPETATTMYNWMLIGMLLIVAAGVLGRKRGGGSRTSSK